MKCLLDFDWIRHDEGTRCAYLVPRIINIGKEVYEVDDDKFN